MKITFKKARIMCGHFFAGRPEEKARLVCRMPNFFGYHLLVFVNTYLSPRPQEGEEWRFSVEEIEADPVTKMARAVAVPIEKLVTAVRTERAQFRYVQPVKNPSTELDQRLIALAAGHKVTPRKHKMTRSALRATRDARLREAEQKAKAKSKKKQSA